MHSFPRKTLTNDVVFEGLGLHSGEPVRVVVKPSESGIAFCHNSQRWAANPENVTDTSRCTRLGNVSTIEHLMAAFAGLGVTDAVVEVEGGELPALDGCAAEFCKGLGAAGIEKFGEAQVDGPFSRVFHIDGEIEIAISTGSGLWRYEFECGERWPNWQHFEFCFSDSFETEVAPARTFAFTEEMEAIRANGLGKGLNETSAFLIGEKGYEHKTRFDDEPARHKLLDLIGDLYLSGIPPQLLNVVGQRSGHRTNVAAAQKLRDHVTFN